MRYVGQEGGYDREEGVSRSGEPVSQVRGYKSGRRVGKSGTSGGVRYGKNEGKGPSVNQITYWRVLTKYNSGT